METTDYIVFKAVRLDFSPVVDLIGRNIFRIDSHIKSRISIGAIGSDSSHQLIVLIGNSIFGRFIRNTVDLMIDFFPFGLIGSLPVNFKQLFDLIEQRLFHFIILSTKLLCPLKHQMFKVMR